MITTEYWSLKRCSFNLHAFACLTTLSFFLISNSLKTQIESIKYLSSLWICESLAICFTLKRVLHAFLINIYATYLVVPQFIPLRWQSTRYIVGILIVVLHIKYGVHTKMYTYKMLINTENHVEQSNRKRQHVSSWSRVRDTQNKNNFFLNDCDSRNMLCAIHVVSKYKLQIEGAEEVDALCHLDGLLSEIILDLSREFILNFKSFAPV